MPHVKKINALDSILQPIIEEGIRCSYQLLNLYVSNESIILLL
jgi:hypothetical protein